MRLLKAFLLFMIFSLTIEMNNAYCRGRRIYTLEDISDLPLCLLQGFLGPLFERKPSDVESFIDLWKEDTYKSLLKIEHPGDCIEFRITKADDKKNEVTLFCTFHLGKGHCICCSNDAWNDVGRMSLRIKYPSSPCEGIQSIDEASSDVISGQEGRVDGVVIVCLVGKVVSVDESSWNQNVHEFQHPESELTSIFVARELTRIKESGTELKPLRALDVGNPQNDLSNKRTDYFCDTVSDHQDFTSRHTEESLKFGKPKDKKKKSTIKRRGVEKI